MPRRAYSGRGTASPSSICKLCTPELKAKGERDRGRRPREALPAPSAAEAGRRVGWLDLSISGPGQPCRRRLPGPLPAKPGAATKAAAVGRRPHAPPLPGRLTEADPACRNMTHTGCWGWACPSASIALGVSFPRNPPPPPPP